jgi:hypothetical protein
MKIVVGGKRKTREITVWDQAVNVVRPQLTAGKEYFFHRVKLGSWQTDAGKVPQITLELELTSKIE